MPESMQNEDYVCNKFQLKIFLTTYFSSSKSCIMYKLVNINQPNGYILTKISLESNFKICRLKTIRNTNFLSSPKAQVVIISCSKK